VLGIVVITAAFVTLISPGKKDEVNKRIPSSKLLNIFWFS